MNLATQRIKFFCVGAAALALAGCADTGSTQGLFGGAPARPKTIVVADFVLSSDVTVIDRGYTARLERKVGSFPTFERKPRTIARVNDEIVAAIVATVREAGLDAQPGNEDALSLKDRAVLIRGRLRPGDDAGAGKNKGSGFGDGRRGVTADMTLSYFSSGGKRRLTTFSADAKDAGRPPAGKQAAARNAAIGAVLAAEKAAPVKLSPDVEAQARRLGRAAGDKIVAYAKEQGWLAVPESAEAQPGAQGETTPDRMPPARPEAKPAT